MLGRLSILIGVLIGYGAAWLQGELDFSTVTEASWVGLPAFHAPAFDLGYLGLFLPVVLVLIAENIGHVKSVAAMTGRDLDHLTGRTLFADGFSTILAGSGHLLRRLRDHHLCREHRRHGSDTHLLHRRLHVRGSHRPHPQHAAEVR